MRKKFLNLLFLFTSLVLSLLVAEIVLRKTGVIKNNYPNSSYWYKAKWLEKHQDGKTAVTNETIDDYDSLFGWVLKANLKNHRIENWKINSDENRIRVSTANKCGDTACIKILTLGDSFTFGECVNDSETYPEFLHSLCLNTLVTNMAVHGWGHDQMLVRLQNEGEKHHPDIVIMGCLNDDLDRNHLWFRDYAKPYFELENDSLVLKGVPVPSLEVIMQTHYSKLYAFLFSKLDLVLYTPHNYQSDLLSEKILTQIVHECRKLKAVPVFVYLPYPDECLSGIPKPAAPFLGVSKKQNVIWINPTVAIMKTIKAQSHPEKNFECHYSAAVARTIAEEIRKKLQSMNLLGINFPDTPRNTF